MLRQRGLGFNLTLSRTVKLNLALVQPLFLARLEWLWLQTDLDPHLRVLRIMVAHQEGTRAINSTLEM